MRKSGDITKEDTKIKLRGCIILNGSSLSLRTRKGNKGYCWVGMEVKDSSFAIRKFSRKEAEKEL